MAAPLLYSHFPLYVRGGEQFRALLFALPPQNMCSLRTNKRRRKKETKARGKEKGKAARCLESVFQAETAMTSWRTYEVVQVRSSASWTIVSTRNGVRCELSRENVLTYPQTGVEMRRGIQRMPPSVPRGDVACRYLSVKVVFKLLLLRVVRLHRMIMMLMALFSLCTEGES